MVLAIRGWCSSPTLWTTISPSFSSSHMASRTSSTRSLLTSMERLLMTCSTQAVAFCASAGLRFASRHSGPWPVKRSPVLSLPLLIHSLQIARSGSGFSLDMEGHSRLKPLLHLVVVCVFLFLFPILEVFAFLVHDVED